MALQQTRPTSPGRRFVVKVTTPNLHKGEPHSPLVTRLDRSTGHNNYGRVTTRHKGGGHKRLYRIIDFRRDKDSVAARVERIEYDPNRSAHLALLLYADGERRYII
ncbi:MAG: 50S ribosomal protein L2, partial [Gammaproteobacteria bacterium]|nr:50S ribosomal protein L2 [Gammaproteobacteria bacterium]